MKTQVGLRKIRFSTELKWNSYLLFVLLIHKNKCNCFIFHLQIKSRHFSASWCLFQLLLSSLMILATCLMFPSTRLAVWHHWGTLWSLPRGCHPAVCCPRLQQPEPYSKRWEKEKYEIKYRQGSIFRFRQERAEQWWCGSGCYGARHPPKFPQWFHIRSGRPHCNGWVCLEVL